MPFLIQDKSIRFDSDTHTIRFRPEKQSQTNRTFKKVVDNTHVKDPADSYQLPWPQKDDEL